MRTLTSNSAYNIVTFKTIIRHTYNIMTTTFVLFVLCFTILSDTVRGTSSNENRTDRTVAAAKTKFIARANGKPPANRAERATNKPRVSESINDIVKRLSGEVEVAKRTSSSEIRDWEMPVRQVSQVLDSGKFGEKITTRKGSTLKISTQVEVPKTINNEEVYDNRIDTVFEESEMVESPIAISPTIVLQSTTVVQPKASQRVSSVNNTSKIPVTTSRNQSIARKTVGPVGSKIKTDFPAQTSKSAGTGRVETKSHTRSNLVSVKPEKTETPSSLARKHSSTLNSISSRTVPPIPKRSDSFSKPSVQPARKRTDSISSSTSTVGRKRTDSVSSISSCSSRMCTHGSPTTTGPRYLAGTVNSYQRASPTMSNLPVRKSSVASLKTSSPISGDKKQSTRRESTAKPYSTNGVQSNKRT